MIKGEKVALIPIKRENIDHYLKWLNDPEITQYLISAFLPLTRDQEEAWFDNRKNRENSIIFSIIVLQDNGQEVLIGNCGIEIDWKNRVGECGIVIGEKDYHGKGYGTKAMELLIQYVFDRLNLHRVQLRTFDFNIRAYKSYKKIGFFEEGRLRNAIFENGTYHDVICMGLLRKEWKLRTKR
jgi:RimJ/RimL family protein N-acetyltransferase